jgi:hypothetical protein
VPLDVPNVAAVRRGFKVPARLAAACGRTRRARVPIGSPGMEYGPRRDPYDVLALSSAGQSHVFACFR